MQRWFLLLLVLVGLCLCSKSFASPLPQQATDILQRREQRLNHTSFGWQLVLEENAPSKSNAAISAMVDKIRRQMPGDLRKHGITDENTIHTMVEEQAISIPNSMKGFAYKSVQNWQFQRDGNQTLVTGAKQEGSFSAFYQYLYEGKNGLVVNDKNREIGFNKLPIYDPVAWRCPGDAIYFRNPLQQTQASLDLLPAHFSTLTGTNPLAMYGAGWNLVSTTPTSWLLEATVGDASQMPSMVRLTLDRLHSGCLVQMHISHGSEDVTFLVKGYKRYQDQWLCSMVELTDNMPGIEAVKQTWTLQNIQDTKPFAITVPRGRYVADYRLLGEQLSDTGLSLRLTQKQQRKIVHYPWTGHFPSDMELQQLFQKQHPGEALPDPNAFNPDSPGGLTPTSRSSAVGSVLPFAGGVLCIAGGVWMFKQRHTR